MSPVVVRFAPSPTGLLHLGNARTAVVNWLFARAQAGRLILRIDDTDRTRSDDAFTAAIREDLHWLGLDWAAEVRQQDRAPAYEAAFARLRADGHAYACHETPDELAAMRAAQRARGEPPRYVPGAVPLTAAERAARAPHWRLRLPDRELAFADLVIGERRFPPGAVSDPVILRADGSPTYLFASAVDDGELGITDVIRGEDHVTNTAAQLAILEALGAPVPRFAHLPLLVDASGRGFSKREGSLTLRALREAGIEPAAIVALLATLGTGAAPDPATTPDELAARFSLGTFGRAPPRLDPGDLPRLSAAALRALPFAAVRDRLPAGADEAFWTTVRGNLDRLADANDWWRILHAPLAPTVTDPDLLRAAAELLPREPLDDAAFAAWTDALKLRTGRKGRALFGPLRLALTGREHGPELRHLLPQLGRERALARLRGATA